MFSNGFITWRQANSLDKNHIFGHKYKTDSRLVHKQGDINNANNYQTMMVYSGKVIWMYNGS